MLKSLSQLGRVEKEFEINKELRVKLHTLSSQEQENVVLNMPDNVESDSTRFVFLQKAVLLFATSEINGEKVVVEDLREFYNSLQYTILVDVFSKYLTLSTEQAAISEELKKK